MRRCLMHPDRRSSTRQAIGRLIGECIREALDRSAIRAEDVTAVSCTSMREGMVLYDADGREIWACPNIDSRAATEAAELVASGDARRLFEQGGDWVSITSPARFAWIRAHEPDVFEQIAQIGMLSDWVIYRLTGRFVTDPSSGSSSNLFDLRSRTWSSSSLSMVGLSPDVVPEVARAGYGRRTRDRSRRRRDRPGGRDAGRGGRCRHAARAGRDRCRRAGTTDARGRQLLADDGRHRRAPHRPAGPGEDALPRSARAVDDRGDRVLLRDRDAVVSRCVLRARTCREPPSGASIRTSSWRRPRPMSRQGPKGSRRSSRMSWTRNAGCRPPRRSLASTSTGRRPRTAGHASGRSRNRPHTQPGATWPSFRS